jgi:uracil-DNA glycosylase
MLTDAEKKLRNTLGYSWFRQVGHLLVEPEMKEVAKYVNGRRKLFNVEVYPAKENVFKAFQLTQFEDIKVVILGQDPYHTKDIAHGLAFSSQDVFEIPPSLENIFKEVEASIYDGLQLAQDANLTRWANQGVFLLNTILTVEKGKALSHDKVGWQCFTTQVIRHLLEDDEPKVFMLWGLAAKASFNEALNGSNKKEHNHLILEAAHPAAESYNKDSTKNAGFFNCDHFALANIFLKEKQFTEIVW